MREHPDLVGLYVAGGGITGAVSALRGSDQAGRLIVVGHDLMDTTRAALLDGILTMAISHPLERLANDAISGMIKAVNSTTENTNYTSVLPFDIHVRENI